MMLKSTIDKWLGGNSTVADSRQVYDANDLTTCLQYFPIGEGISYYPETRSDMQVDSMILGYALNSHMVFSSKDIKVSESRVRLDGENPLTMDLDEVERFCMILPRHDRQEMDWKRNGSKPDTAVATLVNDFARNAPITIFKNSSDGGVPTLDTIVRLSRVLTKGLYINQSASFLEPRFNSFTFIDRRQHCRLKCRIPIRVRCSKDESLCDCILFDFSERHLRIGPAADDASMEKLYEGQHLVVIIDLPEDDKRLVLNGTITRRVRGDVVVMLKGTLHNNYFVDISPIKELEIKAALINHSTTERLPGKL
jgi:hypothetical protein